MKTMSTHALAAKAVRIELKKAFPNIKFSVYSSTYSGGNSIRVCWIDGPVTDKIEKIIRKYQYGHFDGMTDSYDMTNCRNDIPQVKYVFAEREISQSIKDECFKMLQESYNLFDTVKDMHENSSELLQHWGVWTASEYIYRIICKIDLSNGFNMRSY